MSTFKDFRAAVAGEIVAWGASQFPSLPIAYENGPSLDQDKVGPRWLDVEIRTYSAVPLGLGTGKQGRHSGALALNLYSRDGTGTGVSDDILYSLTQLFRRRHLVAGSTLDYPQRTVSTHLLGWYRSGLLIPFTFDES